MRATTSRSLRLRVGSTPRMLALAGVPLAWPWRQEQEQPCVGLRAHLVALAWARSARRGPGRRTRSTRPARSRPRRAATITQARSWTWCSWSRSPAGRLIAITRASWIAAQAPQADAVARPARRCPRSPCPGKIPPQAHARAVRTPQRTRPGGQGRRAREQQQRELQARERQRRPGLASRGALAGSSAICVSVWEALASGPEARLVGRRVRAHAAALPTRLRPLCAGGVRRPSCRRRTGIRSRCALRVGAWAAGTRRGRVPRRPAPARAPRVPPASARSAGAGSRTGGAGAAWTTSCAAWFTPPTTLSTPGT